MKRNTAVVSRFKSICWYDNTIIDWVSGQLLLADFNIKSLGIHYPFSFDCSIISNDRQYAFVFQKLGTKGLLLKNGEQIREINRSYYCANAYEYPAVFVTAKNTTYLIHCPAEYNRLEIENVDTGEIITNVPDRKPSDVFHSRLEIDPSGKFLMSKGWEWHPVNVVYVFNVEDCIQNPLLLDDSGISPKSGTEICTASFINESKILIGSSNDEPYDDENIIMPQSHIAMWDFHENKITNLVKVDGEFGNLFAINEKFAWDTYNYPKIINIQTGKIVDEEKLILSGTQNSSIIYNSEKLPRISFNPQTKQLAIGYDEKIEILTPY